MPALPRARRVPPWVALTALVLVSTAIRAAVARSFTVPWIAPDEMLYGLIGQSLWETGTLTVRGLETPYYSLLYPAFVGLPLSVADLPQAIRVAQVMQALAMSLAAVPVFLWGRRFLSEVGAFVAAALTLAVPALAYSGLLMTEALYYPLVALALLALARVLEQPTAWRQGVFLSAVVVAASVRLQALILLPALVLAALAHARLTRSRTILRRLLPLFAGGAVGALLMVVVAAAGGLSWADILGAYSTLGEESALSAGVLEEVVWHVAGLAVVAAGIPLLATAVLVGRSLRHGEADTHAAAFLATTAAYVPLVVVQVAAFAAGHVEHVSERYLLTAAPPLLLGMLLWVERDAPRSRLLLAVLGVALVATLAVVPVDRIATSQGLQDALSSAVLADLADAASADWVRAVLVLGGIVSILAVAVASRRRGAVVVALVGATLLLQTVVATRDVTSGSAAEQRKALGDDAAAWLDAAGGRGVVLLATGDRPWTADARTYFWNGAIRSVVAVDGAVPAVPPSFVTASLQDTDGALIDDAGAPLEVGEVVAPATMVLEGTKLAAAPAAGSETVGLVLWRVDGPIRVLQRRSGFLPNGDITDSAAVLVPACRPGKLELTLLGKSGVPIDITVNGLPVRTVTPRAGTVLATSIPTPPDADGTRRCLFELRTTNLFGTTRVEYVPDA